MSTNSRYDDSIPFQRESGAAGPFPGVRPRGIGPATGVVEHTLKQWDRADLLARHYYNDCDLWWRILDANPEVMCVIDLHPESGADPDPGATRVVLVPRARE